jgi:hypothetical protein
MADFFTRLAERALGVAPVAAPDLPPMFASTAQPHELSTEIVAPRLRSAEISADKPESSNALVENPTARQILEPAREDMRRGDALRSPLVDLRLVPGQAEDPAFSTHRGEKVSQPAAQPAGNSSFSAANSFASDRVAVESRNQAAPINAKLTPLSEAWAGSPIRAEPATPTIHVTIGRVEVRAVTAPAESARSRERKAPPLRSLDQYLRERNESRR